MKKNDDLLNLAFGELSADAARAVEAQASGDAKARNELQAFRDLRTSLQNLPPPPPDNLSTERLRAAILDRELRNRRQSPFAWAWMPVALAAFAGVVLFTRQPHSPVTPQIVSLGDSGHNVAMDFSFPDFEAPSSVDETPISAAPSKASSALPVARRRASSPRNSRRVATNASNTQDEAEPKYALFQPPTETISAPPSAVVKSGAENPQGDENVVLVSSKRDLETGAPAATETEGKNVLIGG